MNPSEAQGSPAKVFISYAAEEQGALSQLLAHLSPLVRQGECEVWHRGLLVAGDALERVIEAQDAADVVLLLLSAAFLSNEGLMSAASRALARGQRTVPVLVRPCAWQEAPFGRLAALPRDGKAISTYRDADEAWNQVVSALRGVLSSRSAPQQTEDSERDPLRPLLDRLTPSSQDAMERARRYAYADRSGEARPVRMVHLLAGLHDKKVGPTRWLFEQAGLTPRTLRDLWPQAPDVPLNMPSDTQRPLEPSFDAEVERTLRLAAEIAQRRAGDGRIASRDLLAAALSQAESETIQGLLGRGLLGRALGQQEREPRIRLMFTAEPWRLPVESFTIPTGPGRRISGGLSHAFGAALGSHGAPWISQIEKGLSADITPAEPSLIQVPRDLFEKVFPGRVFLATAGRDPTGAGVAAQEICRRAARAGLRSIAINLLGSGDGGLDSVQVRDEMARAIAAGGPYEGLSLVVLATLNREALDAPPPAPSDPPPPLEAEPADAPPSPPPRSLGLQIRGRRAELRSGETLLWSRDLPSDLDQIVVGGAPLTMAEARRNLPSWDRAMTESFGDALCSLLFSSPLPQEVADILPPPADTRLTLSLDAQAAAVPWEYLRVRGIFLIEQRLSMVRHVKAATPTPKPLRMARPTSVLFAWADPDATESYERLAHLKQIGDALLAIQVPCSTISFCTKEELRKALMNGVQGLHYLGHGEYLPGDRPYLLLHGDKADELQANLDADTLATWLLRSGARFVFMGACHSGAVPPESEIGGLAYRIVQRTGIPVVAMQVAVPQLFSTAFAAEFYRCLERTSFDIEQAVYLARQITHEGRSAFGIPVLFADTTAAAAPAELPAPPEEKWARFTFTGPVTLSAPAARARWDQEDLPDKVRDLVRDAFQDLARRPADVPVPDGGALADALSDLVHTWKPRGGEARLREALDALRRHEQRAVAARPEAPQGQVIPLDDRPFRPDWQGVNTRLDVLAKELALPRSLFLRVIAELAAGRHILLTGPVGTGKTSLALALSRLLGFSPYVATAAADWTSYDVVGGFFPRLVQPQGEPARTEIGFRPGAFTEAVMANWVEAPMVAGEPAWRRRQERRTWLVLDEMNRADTDRALGPLFTALETRRLRIPTPAGAAAASTEIPVPEDFRVLATLNGADRHYLSRLSEALKRRFAFIEVPATLELGTEWRIVSGRCLDIAPAAQDPAAAELRRFVYLVRGFMPMGTAQLLAAARFLRASMGAGLPDEERLTQALLGSILPGLEDARPEVLGLCATWAAARDEVALAGALKDTLGRVRRATSGERDDAAGAAGEPLNQALQRIGERVQGLPEDVALPVPGQQGEPAGALDPLALAALLVRRAPFDLPELRLQLDKMRSANEGAGAGL